MVHGPIPEMAATRSMSTTCSASDADDLDSANSAPTATRASALFMVTPDSRTNAALLDASCSGSGGGQNWRPSTTIPALKRSYRRLSVVAAAATLMLWPTMDETTPSNSDPADQGLSPACTRASADRTGSPNCGMTALVPNAAVAHCASRSLLREPEMFSVWASTCRTERQATTPASQPTQTN